MPIYEHDTSSTDVSMRSPRILSPGWYTFRIVQAEGRTSSRSHLPQLSLRFECAAGPMQTDNEGNPWDPAACIPDDNGGRRGVTVWHDIQMPPFVEGDSRPGTGPHDPGYNTKRSEPFFARFKAALGIGPSEALDSDSLPGQVVEARVVRDSYQGTVRAKIAEFNTDPSASRVEQ